MNPGGMSRWPKSPRWRACARPVPTISSSANVNAIICKASGNLKKERFMKKLLVGNAPCSWGTLENQDKSQQIPFNRMLDELVETGYTATELGDWGYMPTDAAA